MEDDQQWVWRVLYSHRHAGVCGHKIPRWRMDRVDPHACLDQYLSSGSIVIIRGWQQVSR